MTSRKTTPKNLTCPLRARTARRIGLRRFFVLALGPWGIFLEGCRTAEHEPDAAPVATRTVTPPTEVRVESSGRASTQHWIQNDDLYAVMKRLGAKTADNWPSTLPDDPEVAVTPEMRERAFREGAALATALADSSREIPRSVATVPMSEADRTTFAGIANGLSDQARLLGQAARGRNVEGMQRHLDSVRSSCMSCHTRFKDISGELPPRT